VRMIATECRSANQSEDQREPPVASDVMPSHGETVANSVPMPSNELVEHQLDDPDAITVRGVVEAVEGPTK
jgi:hypothetical protein